MFLLPVPALLCSCMGLQRPSNDPGPPCAANIPPCCAPGCPNLVGPIPWGHSGPLCHALSLSSLASWTSMRRRRATGQWRHLVNWRVAARCGECAQHFSNASCLDKSSLHDNHASSFVFKVACFYVHQINSSAFQCNFITRIFTV